tara:strand:- start:10 stop:483 length:474 start_codon:yes stop_codon:yes gene_type:complete
MLINFTKTMASFAICFTLIFSPVAFSQDNSESDLVVTLSEGQPAPFSGTLFSTGAAANLLTQLELSNESCQIKIDREVGVKSAQMQLEIDTLSASLLACNQKYTDIIVIKNDHIEFLDNQIAKRSSPKNELWLATGIILGLALGMTSAWSYGQIANQ